MYGSSGDKICTSKTKTLMYFDGCNPVNGCTIILRGLNNRKTMPGRVGHGGSLIQEILRFFIQAVYHGRLEVKIIFWFSMNLTLRRPSFLLIAWLRFQISYLLDQQEFGKLLKTKNFRKTESKQKHLSSSSSSRISASDEKASVLTDGSADNSGNLENVSRPHHITENESVLEIEYEVDHFIEATSDFHQDDHQDARLSNSSGPSNIVTMYRIPIATEDEKPDDRNRQFLTSDSIEFENALSATLLSMSPLVCLSMPYLLSGDGLNTPMLKYLPEKLFWSRIFDKKLSANKVSIHRLENVIFIIIPLIPSFRCKFR